MGLNFGKNDRSYLNLNKTSNKVFSDELLFQETAGYICISEPLFLGFMKERTRSWRCFLQKGFWPPEAMFDKKFRNTYTG